MTNKSNKEPDFFPFRLKDHGWVLKRGISDEEIGQAFRDLVYQLISKDFQQCSIAEQMYNDAVEMMSIASNKAKKAAAARWKNNRSSQTKSLDTENGNASDDYKAPLSSEPFEDASTGNGEENENSGTSSNNSVRGSARPTCETREQSRRTLPPPNAEAVYDFAIKEKLDTADAREWYEINFVDRPGCDKDGVVITNWKGHCKNFCKAAAKKRAG